MLAMETSVGQGLLAALVQDISVIVSQQSGKRESCEVATLQCDITLSFNGIVGFRSSNAEDVQTGE
jgi:hypothetical protein